MRLIVWNCAMALHAKWDRLESLAPDLAVISECAEPTTLWRKRGRRPRCSAAWIGDNSNKGLAVFGFGGHTVHCDPSYDPKYRYFLPARVTGPTRFNLLAVWSFNGRTRPGEKRLRAPIPSALEHYRTFLGPDGPGAVVAGDFNHAVKWDRPGYAGNFAVVASLLGGLGLRSAYHAHESVEFGHERHATHFFRKGAAEYHIDYCFVPESWKVAAVEVGSHAKWLAVSDHAPLLIDL